MFSQPGLEKLNQSQKLKNQSDSKASQTLPPSDGLDVTTSEAETDKPREIGGFKGKEPTRFGDWEKNGRCIDF